MIKVLKLKDLVRNFLKVLIPLIVLFILVQVLKIKKEGINRKAILFPIDYELKKITINNVDNKGFGESIIETQYKFIEEIENTEKEQIVEKQEEDVQVVSNQIETSENYLDKD